MLGRSSCPLAAVSRMSYCEHRVARSTQPVSIADSAVSVAQQPLRGEPMLDEAVDLGAVQVGP